MINVYLFSVQKNALYMANIRCFMALMPQVRPAYMAVNRLFDAKVPYMLEIHHQTLNKYINVRHKQIFKPDRISIPPPARERFIYG